MRKVLTIHPATTRLWGKPQPLVFVTLEGQDYHWESGVLYVPGCNGTTYAFPNETIAQVEIREIA